MVGSTVATASSLEVKVPPVVPSVLIVEVSPTDIVDDVAVNVPTEDSVIVKTTSSVIVHPRSSVKVTVYVNPVDELEEGIAAVGSSKSVVGDQENVTPSPTYVPVRSASTPVHVEASP